MRGRWWIGVTAGVALGLGSVIAVAAATDTESAQAAKFTVSAEQLRINQRISQAAVRRSNESLDLLDPIRRLPKVPNKVLGWRTQDLRDDAVTSAKLSGPVREGQPRWAVVAAGASTLSRAKGATAAAKLPDLGLYTVTFERDVSACALQATIADPGTTPLAAGGEVNAWRSATDPKVVTVRTGDSTGAATNALPFHLTVFC
jgi:hypothetical protein